MNLIQQIKNFARLDRERVAVRAENFSLTYGQLDEWSDRLAAWIGDTCGQDKGPVAVYGHKGAAMPLCFLACVKSGRPYCPVDTSMPLSRIKSILTAVKPKLILADVPEAAGGLGEIAGRSEETVETAGEPGAEAGAPLLVRSDEFMEIARTYEKKVSFGDALKEEDVFYIIFTSGSTGTPKGVEITRGCLERYLDWAVELGRGRDWKEGRVFLSQAPFSFDLSVMDTYCSLACGGVLCTLSHETQTDYSKLMRFLKSSGTEVWVSTPSFAEVCLAEPAFSQAMLPDLRVFLFCGETLTPATADKLLRRFPEAVVVNTYGPTESTVAVTQTEITAELLAERPASLPVGRVKPGSAIEIIRPDGSQAAEGEEGEILILGDTVAAGYFQNPLMTERAFFQRQIDGRLCRGYRTGDRGVLKEGMLYFRGRADEQIKLRGYRIELGDIESNLCALSGVSRAAVIPAGVRGEGAVRSLTAYVEGVKPEENGMEVARQLKKELRELLPDYMIPKKIIFLERLPVTENGKTDRRQLREMTR